MRLILLCRPSSDALMSTWCLVSLGVLVMLPAAPWHTSPSSSFVAAPWHVSCFLSTTVVFRHIGRSSLLTVALWYVRRFSSLASSSWHVWRFLSHASSSCQVRRSLSPTAAPRHTSCFLACDLLLDPLCCSTSTYSPVWTLSPRRYLSYWSERSFDIAFKSFCRYVPYQSRGIFEIALESLLIR